MGSVTWDRSRIKTLIRLLRSGLSTSEISAEFKGAFSRGAISSAIHRFDLGGERPNAVKPPKRERVYVRNDPLPPAPPEPEKESLEPDPIGKICDFPPYSGYCKWIHGDVATTQWRCCGHPTLWGSVYCQHHHNRAYTKVLKRG